MRGLLTVLVCAALAACGRDEAPATVSPVSPIRARIEKEVRTRLRAAVRAETAAAAADPVLTDDTPRFEIRDEEKEGLEEGVALVFLRAASVRIPTTGLDAVGVAADDRGLLLRLGYGAAELTILDGTDSPGASAEVERLKAAGAQIGLDDWEAIDGAVEAWAAAEGHSKAAIDEELAAVQRFLEERGQRWGNRFGKDLGRLRRAAMRASVQEARGEDLGEVYDACRLLVVKREIVAGLEGPSDSPAWPLAAGPTTGVCRGQPGNGSLHAILDGPDGMSIEVHVRGAALTEDQARLLLGSCRPYARSRGRARAYEKQKDGLPAVLARVSSLHLDPEPGRAVALLDALRPIQPLAQRVQLAETLATWLSCADDERRQVLAAAAEK